MHWSVGICSMLSRIGQASERLGGEHPSLFAGGVESRSSTQNPRVPLLFVFTDLVRFTMYDASRRRIIVDSLKVLGHANENEDITFLYYVDGPIYFSPRLYFRFGSMK